MKKQRRPKKKFTIDLVSIRAAVGREQKVANASIKAGKALAKRSRKEGRTGDTKTNVASLKEANKAKVGLARVLKILKACCGNKRYNADPMYF